MFPWRLFIFISRSWEFPMQKFIVELHINFIFFISCRVHVAEKSLAVDFVMTMLRRTLLIENSWKSSFVQSVTHVRRFRQIARNVEFASENIHVSSATYSTTMTNLSIIATLVEYVELAARTVSSIAKCVICVCQFS